MRVESLPDVTDFFATLQSPMTPLLPSFWAGETLFAGLQGRLRLRARRRALDDGAGVRAWCWRAADERWHFAGFSRSQEAPQGALHAASQRSTRSRARCRCRRSGGSC